MYLLLPEFLIKAMILDLRQLNCIGMKVMEKLNPMISFNFITGQFILFGDANFQIGIPNSSIDKSAEQDSVALFCIGSAWELHRKWTWVIILPCVPCVGGGIMSCNAAQVKQYGGG